ncbi:unnamed protein product [Rotaria sp. Silwood2]|nr:unnamed protein product [Rotaria sp. Silwood2]CAF3181364.1 unnamed protein product [Rotaria sp. Silwood2]CAF3460865.1 unnamed protein product [Rotaria sp. Silwood2]CAF4262909.1 unnamed protein product [Rotaria sp. Silwood2]CAF4526805.1 unnamed protein product [Rotaria sp. Silwood2]
MSMISIMICTFFSISTISAIPATGVVLSAVIRNTQNTPVQCTINWTTYNGPTSNQDIIMVESNKYKLVFEKSIYIGTSIADVFIQEIHCGDLVLTTPFARVLAIERLWEFRVESDRIVSVGRSSYVP